MDVKDPFIATLMFSFFIALGVLIGGALIGGFAAFLVGDAPLSRIDRLAGSLKIWAIVAAIGGTFDTFYTLEAGLFNGETKFLVKQLLLIITATGGAQTGALVISWLTQEPL
ncbi:YtrH family sporulation protein [Sutcliffiella cohnii]|uniref:Sporulation protein n=1 Tax=Sutcliffiella cohnii TaxID=33932 RepID=A0A223KTP2_9BACI|nr:MULTISPECIES: YtrH family sporulation protein [Sutcliffiella]AST92840.1 sporulation protein [Sutcliffiella cohnii]MED4016209.1 YtrH family sporulation protein [Sutcliffiella cohnii]WBL14096.1 YtrH family sporulation protein [Sutcliffiella sp. NC1]